MPPTPRQIRTGLCRVLADWRARLDRFDRDLVEAAQIAGHYRLFPPLRDLARAGDDGQDLRLTAELRAMTDDREDVQTDLDPDLQAAKLAATLKAAIAPAPVSQRIHSPAGILAEEVAQLVQRHAPDSVEARVPIQAFAALVSAENTAEGLRQRVDELQRRLASPAAIDNPGAAEALHDLLDDLAARVAEVTGRPMIAPGRFTTATAEQLLHDLQHELEQSLGEELLLACAYFDGGETFDPERLAELLRQAVALTRQLRADARRSGRAFADLIASLTPPPAKAKGGRK